MKGTFGPERFAVRRDDYAREKTLRIPIIVTILLICLCLVGYTWSKYKKYQVQVQPTVSVSYSEKIKNWFALRKSPKVVKILPAKNIARNRPTEVHFEFYRSLPQMDVKRVLKKQVATTEKPPSTSAPKVTKSPAKNKANVPLALFADAKALEQDLHEQLNKNNKTR